MHAALQKKSAHADLVGFSTFLLRRGMAFGAVGEASSSVLVHAKACAEAISKEAMSDGDVDAVTKDTGYGRVLGEIIRDWGVACAKRRAECLIKLVSKTVPNISTASGGGRLATDYNKFTRRCRVVAQSAPGPWSPQ